MIITRIPRHSLSLFSGLSLLLLVASCTTQKGTQKHLAEQGIALDSALKDAHVGISVYDVSEKEFLYNYQESKYFLPASNTKLFSLYEGLKWLGDSLIAARYIQTDTAFFLLPAGDPTLLHPDFARQPLISLLQKLRKNIL